MTLSLPTARFFFGKNSASSFREFKLEKIRTEKQRVSREANVCNVKEYDPDDEGDKSQKEKIFTQVGILRLRTIRRETRRGLRHTQFLRLFAVGRYRRLSRKSVQVLRRLGRERVHSANQINWGLSNAD